MVVTREVRPELLFTLPRRPGDDGPALTGVHAPQTSVASDTAPSLAWTPPRVRVSHTGAVALLAEGDGGAATALELGPGGAVERATSIPRGGGRVVDFLPLGGEGVLVLGSAGRDTVLRLVAPDGSEAWRRAGPAGIRTLDWEGLEGTFDRLLADGDGTAYLAAARPVCSVARVSGGGELEPLAELGPPGAGVQMDERGRLYTVGYDPASKTRTWNRHDPATGETATVRCDEEASAALVLPVGVDGESRAYGADATSLTCVGSDGRVAWRFAADSALPAGDGTVLTAATTPDGALEVVAWTPGGRGEERRLPLPPPAASAPSPGA